MIPTALVPIQPFPRKCGCSSWHRCRLFGRYPFAGGREDFTQGSPRPPQIQRYRTVLSRNLISGLLFLFSRVQTLPLWESALPFHGAVPYAALSQQGKGLTCHELQAPCKVTIPQKREANPPDLLPIFWVSRRFFRYE